MNGMDKVCPDESLLAAWIEKTLDADARVRLSGHLADCDDCRRSVALAASQVPCEAAQGGVNEVLLARLLGKGSSRWLWTSAAAAGLLVAAGLVLLRPERPVPDVTVAVRAPVPPAAAPVPAEPKKEPVREPERPAPVAELPVPAPQPKPPTPTPAPPLPAPVADLPKPAPVAVPEPPKEPVRNPAPATTTDYAKIFDSVFLGDPTGDLWLSRERAESAKVAPVERVGWQDVLSARGAAGCTLEARASLVLEKGAEAGVMLFKPDGAYRLLLTRGQALIDTEGTVQKWQIVSESQQIEFRELNGRVSLEARSDGLAALLLEGRGDLVVAGSARRAQVGREVVLSREGAVAELKADVRKKLARLVELRPKQSTAFAVSFDELKDEVRPFPYNLVSGRLVAGPSGGYYLMADSVIHPARPSEKPALVASLKPDRAFPASSGMVLKFRCRTNLSKVTLELGKYGIDHVPKARPGQWGEVEVPLRDFMFEGTPLIPSDLIEEIRFSGAGAARGGQLDLDGVQFLRRTR